MYGPCILWQFLWQSGSRKGGRQPTSRCKRFYYIRAANFCRQNCNRYIMYLEPPFEPGPVWFPSNGTRYAALARPCTPKTPVCFSLVRLLALMKEHISGSFMPEAFSPLTPGYYASTHRNTTPAPTSLVAVFAVRSASRDFGKERQRVFVLCASRLNTYENRQGER